MNDRTASLTRARSSRTVAGVHVEDRPQAPGRGQGGQRGLDVDPDVAGAHGQRQRLAGDQAGQRGVVDEQAPDLLVGHDPGELGDVDAAVAQGAAVAVGLGDRRLEGDDALEAVRDRRWSSCCGATDMRAPR